MSHLIIVPRLGWSMDEGVFSQWLLADGEIVKAGDMLFMLEGEKAVHEIESFDSGRLCVPVDAPQPGQTVKVGEVIGFLLAESEAAPSSIHAFNSSSSQEHSEREGSRHATSQAAPIQTSLAQTTPASSWSVSSSRPVGPAARRLARKLGKRNPMTW